MTPGDIAAVSCEILQLNLWLLIVTEADTSALKADTSEPGSF